MIDRYALPQDPWLDTLLSQSLAEDIGPGDASTAITVDTSVRATAAVTAREKGVIAGLPLLDLLYQRLDPTITVKHLAADGDRLAVGDVAAVIEGSAGPVLTGERTALNFLQQLSGIASLTARYVEAVAGTSCQVLDTRKTLPGWRLLAKYAVRCGGGTNHRLGLYDRIMLKDNHWAAGADRVADLVARGRREFPDLAIEVEVDDLSQLDLVLPLGVEWVLLDNFDHSQAAEAVARRNAGGARTLLEASGNVTIETIGGFAEAGVDACSVGRLTHSAPALDLGLDLELSS